MRNLITLLFLVGLFFLAFLAGGEEEPRADLTFPYESIETLDPQRASSTFDIRVSYALFEGLCTFNPYDFSIQPGVAQRWTISKDRKTYAFYLRDDARWSNGDPITTHDFLYTWRLGLQPGISPKYIDYLYHIKGAKTYWRWCMDSLAQVRKETDASKRLKLAQQRVDKMPGQFAKMVGVRADGAGKLIVELEQPLPYFLEIVASWPLFPLHAASIKKEMALDTATGMVLRDPMWTRPGRMVNNGPYLLKRWRVKRDIKLEQNPYYWNRQIVGSKSVHLINFRSPNTMFYAYEKGQLDMYLGTTVAFKPELVKASRQGLRNDVHVTNSFGTYYYVLNTRPKLDDGSDNPLADVRVRQVLAMSIDKKTLVDDVTRLHQPVSNTLIPKGAIAGYHSPQGLPYDIEKAKQLLTEAGYPKGKGLTVEIYFNNEGAHTIQAQAIAQMWQKKLGITVTMKSQEWKVFLSRRNNGNFMIGRSGWFGDYLDPTTFLELAKTDNGNNDSGISDPKYDQMLDVASIETNSAKRMKILQQAEQYMLTEMVPLIPFYQYELIHLYDPDKVQGVSLHPRDLQFYHLIKVKR